MLGIGHQHQRPNQGHGKVMLDMDRLAKAWIFAQKLGVDSLGYEKHSWAVDEVINFATEKPEDLWQVILKILELDGSNEIAKAVGAGPLEDLMVHHGEGFIDKVEEQASKSDVFKTAMKSVWLDSDDTPICARFFETRGQI